MVAQVPDRRTGRLAGAVGIALLLAGLTLLLEPASRRAGAAALLAVGLAAGAVVALRLPAVAAATGGQQQGQRQRDQLAHIGSSWLRAQLARMGPYQAR
ncbi:MAG TPA: hypothetical protein VJ769_09485 [Actinomycetes bacterium]|nr:hypothetical protein [Actinomycetes bacterium]